MDKTSAEDTIQGMAFAKKSAELTDDMIAPDGSVDKYAAQQALQTLTKACECLKKAGAISKSSK